ncbi:hypothetical protein MUY35_04040 [Aliiroseovarius sp. S1339]|uniref:hypothetical protein n=1 Tax=Aliiroseovarius sp. S1339 TaxID=2936990 RepID=UPI0020C12270|nr:hypothetical protein [Aliiroseovarius sp. S1339]MCK8463017.1 hypothetical protein [Aliiroseovarius sp. S1339]
MISVCKATAISLIVATVPLLGAASECEPQMPQLTVFEQHIANRGQARNAYQLAAKERAVAAQSCACPFDNWGFGAFIHFRLDKPVGELNQQEIRALRQWSDAEGVAILRAYGEFFSAQCHEGE